MDKKMEELRDKMDDPNFSNYASSSFTTIFGYSQVDAQYLIFHKKNFICLGPMHENDVSNLNLYPV